MQQLYREQIDHLASCHAACLAGETPAAPIRRLPLFIAHQDTTTVAQADTKLTYGLWRARHLRGHADPARPVCQLLWRATGLLILLAIQVPIEVGLSDKPILIHFSFAGTTISRLAHARAPHADARCVRSTRSGDHGDGIANGTWRPSSLARRCRCRCSPPRVDYFAAPPAPLHRHGARLVQNFVLFTNYQFYIDEFIRLGHAEMAKENSEYIAFYRARQCRHPRTRPERPKP